MPVWALKLMPRGLGLAGAAGITSGIVILSVISGGKLGFVLAYVAALPLMLVGLAFGPASAAMACLVGTGVVAAAGLAAVPAFWVIGALPALLLTVTALRRKIGADGAAVWPEAREILPVMAGGAVLVMGLVCLAIPSEGDKTIEATLRDQAAPMFETVWPEATPDLRAAVVAMSVAIMPSIIGTAWFMMTLLNGLTAQWAVSQAGKALRPLPGGAGLTVPLGLAVLAGLAFAGRFLGGNAGYLAQNAAILLMLPFLVAGLADVHRMLRATPWAGLWLGLFYGVFIALFGWAAMAVTAWGLVRQCIRVGRRKPAHTKEG